jgi:RNA polymerase sigma-70 factor (ECF subfamily)
MSDMTPSDAARATGVQRGDVDIFTALVREHVDGLTRFAFSLVADEDTAHDIVQDVFARIWHLGSDWNPSGGIEAYLFSAVRHRALNVLRNRRTRQRAEDVMRTLDLGETHPDPYVDVALVQRVSKEFLALTDRQRDALRLRYGQGHTMAQIAQILGIDLRATERLVTRGLAALRTRLIGDRKEPK